MPLRRGASTTMLFVETDVTMISVAIKFQS